jgi:hypothetical protein
LNLVDGEASFSIGKGCCNVGGGPNDVGQQVANACKMVANNVTNQVLRLCIMARCENASVSCDGLWCSYSPLNTVAWNIPIGINRHWGCVAIHEWAETCGWAHGGGGGIPGNSGSYSYEERKAWGPLAGVASEPGGSSGDLDGRTRDPYRDDDGPRLDFQASRILWMVGACASSFASKRSILALWRDCTFHSKHGRFRFCRIPCFREPLAPGHVRPWSRAALSFRTSSCSVCRSRCRSTGPGSWGCRRKPVGAWRTAYCTS